MKKIIALTFVTLALAGCGQKEVKKVETPKVKSPICDSTANMPGGWQATEVTPDIHQALKLVMSHMDTSSKLAGIVSVHSQVVNGINYAIEYRLSDNTVWHVIVYRSLKGEYAISQPPQPGPICQ
ncbi:cystatin domain-containing protein [Vibrio sp. S4M6]|uniref:cystatin domain-containing protein n=1 Tax=Vibrio sinus TaxID=2946865 RepID=UPI00202A9B95|nr:cystatin domain-containing protein [Vibrio sinus]MCL9780018.1 cystatin domain-containing protein [Vibrio sinus]